ncbi:phosphoribosylformylglycinamidine synthase subunit PurQ [Mesorhizobium sp. BR1-1-16]|uniref:phosphoribosylformylglycinamidine synthase subunit PurQ n=1 Tax=Mesorhizobium sp. BR1-1-16 TaxID=2876653 RepID=UPI001CC8EF5A|nr:phosphoribosylformylglycinamidine synthase subunit PurQ [Mesorhizobium sp. BR1-1-16]MBZ9937570.1 phosphoribosylformylglycinamidine synthase subunit PurQ [Mesorhizobium sp. BR1-1-16]
MKSAVVVFPGSNRERDMIATLEKISGQRPVSVWHADSELPKVDLIVIPGGFSYGDYLRSGAIAARAPIMAAIAREAERGVAVLGVCNGFQILCEAGLLPGVLMRNAGLRFICKEVELRVETTASVFTSGYAKGQVIRSPVAHGDGNYRADDETLARLKGEDRIAFRYVGNPNGSIDDIAGILSEKRNILGMMPHPENLIEPLNGGTDGRPLFESALKAVA